MAMHGTLPRDSLRTVTSFGTDAWVSAGAPRWRNNWGLTSTGRGYGNFRVDPERGTDDAFAALKLVAQRLTLGAGLLLSSSIAWPQPILISARFRINCLWWHCILSCG